MEYTPVEQKLHKKQEYEQWRLLKLLAKLTFSKNSAYLYPGHQIEFKYFLKMCDVINNLHVRKM